MTAQSIVTLWHKTGEEYEKTTHNAHIFLRVSIEKSGIKEKGFHSGKRCEIRLPSHKEIAVSTGDFISIGECDREPLLRTDFKITEIYDNRRGGEPHYRIVAQR